MADRGLHGACFVRVSLCVLFLSVATVVTQDSRVVSMDDAARAKTIIKNDNDDSSQDSNETVLDDNDSQQHSPDHQEDLKWEHEQHPDLEEDAEEEGKGHEKEGDEEQGDEEEGDEEKEEEGKDHEEEEEEEEEGKAHAEEGEEEEEGKAHAEEGEKEEEGEGKAHEEEEVHEEEQEDSADQEAVADVQDASLPEVIDESKDDTKYARILEIDQTVTRQRRHDGDYAHPFHQPNIVENVMYTYRRFRKMKLMRHGKFWMGTNDPRSETGEYPVREVPVRSFYLDIYPIINAFYWAFRAKKKFARSEAEVRGWSWVTEMVVSDVTRKNFSTPGPKGWLAVKKARWDQPEGPDSNLEDRWTHPVVHLSWYDAKKFCEFHGKRLPTEQEWEYAARAGLVAEEYPWGDRWERRRANTWQGKWPKFNSEADGYKTTSPVDAYRPQNIIGLYDMIGNVWEWTHSRYFERLIDRDLQGQMHVLKGASFIDSVDGETNLAVRNGQRSGQAPDYTASNIGFRCARSAPEVGPVFKPRKVKKAKDKDRKKPRIPIIYRKPKRPKDEF